MSRRDPTIRLSQGQLITYARNWVVDHYGPVLDAKDPFVWQARLGLLTDFITSLFGSSSDTASQPVLGVLDSGGRPRSRPRAPWLSWTPDEFCAAAVEANEARGAQSLSEAELRDFCAYWWQPTRNNNPRYKSQQTWDMALRLATCWRMVVEPQRIRRGMPVLNQPMVDDGAKPTPEQEQEYARWKASQRGAPKAVRAAPAISEVPAVPDSPAVPESPAESGTP